NDYDPVPKLDLDANGFPSALHTSVTATKPRRLNPLTTHNMKSLVCKRARSAETSKSEHYELCTSWIQCDWCKKYYN
ncbi:MAG: hypothetical protein QM571_05885, partial [Micrococcaceae bacterium]